ncbi:MAG: hypothetical protein ACYCSJ_05625, partial [Acidimicrobiales bacterium]
MPNLDHRFQIDGPGPSGEVRALLGSDRLGPAGAAVEVRRTWYDSFDGRLRSEGLTLCREATAGRHVLVLSDGTARLAETEAGAEDPSRAGLLPAGPLRQRIAPLLEDRVLLPLAELVSRERATPVLNRDQKTVAR